MVRFILCFTSCIICMTMYITCWLFEGKIYNWTSYVSMFILHCPCLSRTCDLYLTSFWWLINLFHFHCQCSERWDIIMCPHLGQIKKNMCVYGHMWKKSRVGRSAFIFYFILFFIIGKTGNSRSRFRNSIPVFHFRNFR
jgi:hypothetical protein